MIFVDTGVWIALYDRKDQYHQKAVSIYNQIKSNREGLFTTDFVLDETVTRLRYDLNHSIAVKFLDYINRASNSDILTIITINKDVFKAAEKMFRTYDSATLSFTDCTSFVVCQKYDISTAFAFDQHFTIPGISLLIYPKNP